jgi:hypothetical protein
MLACILVVRALLVVAAVQVQQPPSSSPPTGLILGRVVDAGTGRPVAGAIVSLLGPGSPRALTSGSGQFVFRKLPKGRFNLVASKPGYVDGAYGRQQPGGAQRSIEVADAQPVGDVTIMMWRHAAISGTVTDEAGEPLVGVTVRLFQRRYSAGHRRFLSAGLVNTDDRGMYRFAQLAPGEYVAAFVSHEVSVPPEVVDLVRMPQSPSDTKAQDIMRERFSIGLFSMQSVQVGSTARQIETSAPVPPISDDAAAPVYVYPTLFYPNAPSAARAAVITVQAGQEREAIDLSLHPVRASRVSGSVIGPEGPASDLGVHLVSAAEDDIQELEPGAAMTDANGTFTLAAVSAGQYVIKAARIPRPPARAADQTTTMTMIQVGGSLTTGFSSSATDPLQNSPPPIPDDPAFYANTAVVVGDRDLNGVVVMLQHGGRLSGRVEFDGSHDRPDAAALSRISVTLDRADLSVTPLPGLPGNSGPPPGRVEANGTFKTYGQPPGRYLLRVGALPGGWTLKSVIAEGRDISDAPFDLGTSDIGNVVITYTDRPTKLSGVARTKDGNPDTEALIVVFPSDPAGWTDVGTNPRRVRSTRPTSNGTYTFNALPAGEYYVAAILEGAVSSWQDPQVLADLARTATAVRLGEGDTRTQDVVRSGGDR